MPVLLSARKGVSGKFEAANEVIRISEDRCTDDALGDAEALEREAVAEAREEFPIIIEALEAYFAENGVYPESLEPLGLDPEIAETTVTSTAFYRYNNLDGSVQEDPQILDCGFNLDLRLELLEFVEDAEVQETRFC